MTTRYPIPACPRGKNKKYQTSCYFHLVLADMWLNTFYLADNSAVRFPDENLSFQDAVSADGLSPLWIVQLRRSELRISYETGVRTKHVLLKFTLYDKKSKMASNWLASMLPANQKPGVTILPTKTDLTQTIRSNPCPGPAERVKTRYNLKLMAASLFKLRQHWHRYFSGRPQGII